MNAAAPLPSSNQEIAVSIVEDDEPLRRTLAQYLNTPGFRCVSAHGSAEEALALLGEKKPSVILMDISLPGSSGIECVAGLKAILPASKCIMLTAFGENELIFKALAAGALGYLLKSVRPSKLLESIREVHEGGSPMSGEIARQVVASFQKPPRQPAPGEQLSGREQEVLEYLAQGLLYKQIAAQMGISLGTVRTYAQRIYEKLHVHTRTEAVVKHFNR